MLIGEKDVQNSIKYVGIALFWTITSGPKKDTITTKRANALQSNKPRFIKKASLCGGK